MLRCEKPIPVKKGDEALIPVFVSRIPAGFPSPADDFMDDQININDELIKNEVATFIMRVNGVSMKGDGIMDGDFVVVDKSIDAKPGHIVVACVEGEFTLKRLVHFNSQWMLRASHKDYPDLLVNEDFDTTQIWGVVVGSFRKFPV